MRFREEGRVFIWGAFGLGLLTGIVKLYFLSLLFFVLSLIFVGFFRDPDRKINYIPGFAISPADGKVVELKRGIDGWYISIFMSVFDCHVNRAPVSGTVERIDYVPGGRKPAFLKSISSNARNMLVINSDYGKVRVTQIAGILASKILCWVNEGDEVRAGDRIGMIMFGSRVDLFLPGDWEIFVTKGSKVKAGETIIGRLI